VEVQRIRIHGHEIAYRAAGSGSDPVVLLIHGMASSSATWDGVIPVLAEHATVVAPDMPGHGESGGGGDQSLGALASSLRDVLLSLGHDRATVVGHSLGGGVAMQFAYQFPQASERLVLVSAGGLGRDVALFLRALAFPGLELLIPPAFAPRIHDAGASVVRLLGKIGIRPGPAFEEIWRDYGMLTRKETRQAFFATLRSVVDPAGQRVSATDRLYLAAAMPTLIVWGEKDSIIPVRHGREAHEAMPGSRLEIFERSGHFPQHQEPERFAGVLVEFIRTTEPADLTPARIRELLAAAVAAEIEEGSLTG
jgi:pimeloyl-ACP methyl ester carboxylesterase